MRTHPAPAHARTETGESRREHDACGVGFVARATGERSHEIVRIVARQ